MDKKSLKYSLKTKILASFLCVSILSMTVVLSYTVIVQQNVMKQQLRSDGERDIAHSLNKIENQMIQISNFVSWAVNNEDIQERLHRDANSANRYDEQMYSIISQLTDQLSYRPIGEYLRGLFILGNNGADIRSGSEASLFSEQALAEFKQMNYDACRWGKSLENTIPFTIPGKILPYNHPICDADGHQIGNLLLLFSDNMFSDCYDGMLQDSVNIPTLYNSDGELICCSTQTVKSDYIQVQKTSNVIGWQIDFQISTDILRQQRRTAFFSVLLFGCMLFFVIFIISWILTRTITAPLERVITRVQDISNGTTRLIDRRMERSEIDYLENRILDMHEALLCSMEQERQREREKQQLEIQVLQEQMNPHFLYHTLNTIRLMAIMQGKQSIAKVTEMLIQLMRASLSHPEAKVTIAQELEFWESYMYIQNISKKGKLQWDISIDKQILQQKIPKLLLQPLAENAITHGFAEKSDIGKIHLCGRKEGETIVLRMEDNGAGIDSGRLAEITDALHHPEKQLHPSDTATSHSHGMALVNIQKRIQLHDGELFGLTIESELGNGCCVTIRLPFEKNE